MLFRSLLSLPFALVPSTNAVVFSTLKVDITEDASLEHKTKILYEMVQIANLCPLESEEAKALIPRYVFA